MQAYEYNPNTESLQQEEHEMEIYLNYIESLRQG